MGDFSQGEQLKIDAMMKMALLLAVEQLGGELRLPVSEIDTAPVGKRLDMDVLAENGETVFRFRVTRNG
jgi:hypothetical protein